MSNILVVDDNEINSMLAQDMIVACGVTADIADCGEKAVEMAQKQNYRVIFMDNIMPGISGVEATRRIKQIRPTTTIYAMTGDMNEQVVKEFREAGAAGMIAKPLVLAQITEIIRNHLDLGTYEIPESSIEPKAEGEDSPAAILKQYISKVEKLDFDKGLFNAVGNVDTYLRVLKAAVANIRQFTDIMKEYTPGADVMPLKVAVHSLKSVYANIGIEWMERDSVKLEKEANHVIAGDADADYARGRLEAALGAYQEHSDNLAGQLEAALGEYLKLVNEISPEYYTVAEQELSEADIAETLAYTRTALDRCEIDYVNEGLELLKKTSIGDARRQVEQAIDLAAIFDYDGVRRIIEKVFA